MRYGVNLLLLIAGVLIACLPLWGGKELFGIRDQLIPAGKAFILRYAKGRIFVVENPVSLTEKAERAVKVAPQWLRLDLADNLSALPSQLQDKYAELILRCPDKKYLDEVAFCIAHISPEVLKAPSFDPNIIWENARQIYEADKLLDFVQLVEKGDYTTVRYFIEENGEIRTYELPRDYYYWFVVHPQFFTEIPRRIDGYFWREYFLNRSDEGYPKLRDYLKGVKVLWDSKPLSVSHKELEEKSESLCYALHRIGLWVMKQLPMQRSLRERPLQPIEVLKGHRGSCTENQAVLACALRACLIPAAYARDFSEDHEWVEFFILNGWHPIQTDMGGSALQIDYPPGISYDKDFGGSKELSSVSIVRPDGFIIEGVSHHSKTTKVKIRVVDEGNEPLDGVLVKVFTPYYPATTGDCNSLCTYAYTNINGECEFTLGQNRDYLIVAGSETYPIRNAEEMEVYQKTFVLPDEENRLRKLVSPLPQGNSSPLLRLHCNPHSHILYGKNLLPDFRRPEVRPEFSQRFSGGRLTVLICDKENFLRYKKGERFSASIFEVGGGKGKAIPLRLKENKEWFIVFHNEFKTAKVIADIQLEKTTGAR